MPTPCLELEHGLNQLPLKGQVLVRPLDGPNAGLHFQGIGAAQADDDLQDEYCGVLLFYNETHVRVVAPTVNNDNTGGHIFCAGILLDFLLMFHFVEIPLYSYRLTLY